MEDHTPWQDWAQQWDTRYLFWMSSLSQATISKLTVVSKKYFLALLRKHEDMDNIEDLRRSGQPRQLREANVYINKVGVPQSTQSAMVFWCWFSLPFLCLTSCQPDMVCVNWRGLPAAKHWDRLDAYLWWSSQDDHFLDASRLLQGASGAATLIHLNGRDSKQLA